MFGLRRSTDPHIELLEDLDLFADCSRKQLRRIGSLTTLIEMGQGRVLIQEDRRELEFFVVVAGTASVSRRGLRLAELGPGSFFGETACLDRGRRTATVAAETEMVLLVFSLAEFCSLQALAPSVAEKMTLELSRRLRSTDELLDDGPAVPCSCRTRVLQRRGA